MLRARWERSCAKCDTPSAMQKIAETGNFELGLDEAGRGPMLGPLVLAAVALSRTAQEELVSLGVQDSKRFGAGEKAHVRRKFLMTEIQKRALFCEVTVVEAHEVDAAVFKGGLNELEREVAARLLLRSPQVDRICADGERLFGSLAKRFPLRNFVAQDKADSLFPTVAAASVCAKVVRDERWFAFCERHRAAFPEELKGHCGGGYVNEATRRFLRAYVQKHGRLPDETRLSWPRDFLADVLPQTELRF